MKIKFSFFAFALLLFCCVNLYAQRTKNNYNAVPFSNHKSWKYAKDTLKPASFYTGTPTLYKYYDDSIGRGYNFGTSMLGDRGLAQVYKVTTPYVIRGIALYVGAFRQVGLADTLNILIYNLNGPGTDSAGPVNNAPGTAALNIILRDSLVNTTGLTFITFPDSIIANADYAAGIGLTQMNDDTIGLITTKDSDAHFTQLSWEKCSDNTWHTTLDPLNWHMDLDLGIFMIVDTGTASINGNYFIDGIKLSQNQPNPAAVSTLIQYEIQNSDEVALEIYDLNGKLIMKFDEGKQGTGRHEINIDAHKLNCGVYYYSLKAGAHRLTKKMVIL